MKKIILIIALLLVGTLSACTLGKKSFSLREQPKVKYGEEVNKKIEKGEYLYRDETQVAEEMELLLPAGESTEIEDIEKEMRSFEILEEDFSDL